MPRDGLADLPAGPGVGIVVDLFAGGGGASLGIERALGRPVDVAVNHDPEAVALHRRNHPFTDHHCSDVFEVDPLEATGGRPVALLWGSPDCFPAGTLVLTVTGYRPIETIAIGDVVLTHRGRWRPVTALMTGMKATVTVRAQGHPGLTCSDGHKFWARREKLGEPDWMPASELGRGSYMAAPHAIAPLPRPIMRHGADRLAFWWTVGRYLADGWASETKGIVLTVGPDKAASTAAALDETGLVWRRRETATAVQFTHYDARLCRWLHAHFGHLAHAKTIPGWVLGLDVERRRALLAGYTAGDGHERGGQMQTSTVSPALAFGMRTLCETLGYTATVYRGENRESEIGGRIVTARHPVWKLRYRETVDAAHRQTVRDPLHHWYPVRQVTPAGARQVFNITVDEDHSYVVEGIVAKNCKHFSKAKGGKPVEKRIRALAWVLVQWAARVRPAVIMLENVEEFVTWGPLDGDRPDAARKGETFARWVAALRRLGYAVEWRELRACDHGAPTIRKRLFVVARCDGLPIAWPAPTHGDPAKPETRGASKTGARKLKPWRTAAEIIDWSLPCPSIFLTREEARSIGCNRPLAEATMQRIARGVKRYVIDAAKPFIVPITHTQATRRPHGIREPVRTITTGGWHEAEVRAFLVKYYSEGGQWQGCDEPAHTVPTRDRLGLVMVAGEPYRIVDIGMRMLTPRELYRAQGFPDSYVIDAGREPDGTGRARWLTKTAQIRMAGNSVCPPVAEALVRANMAAVAASPDAMTGAA